MARLKRAIALVPLACMACATGGSAWMGEPLVARPPRWVESAASAPTPTPLAMPMPMPTEVPTPLPSAAPVGGTVVGVFRNTYYDFPSESDYEGDRVSVMSAACAPIAAVPRGFYETVCVQGSGLLRDGRAVSFARRDCACAEVCPRSGQRVCFEALDARRFPWGRGATGRAITPLVTVAADTRVLPLGTRIYVAAFDGVARAEGSSERLDGCFVVEDRGVRITGAHIDVFAGDEATRAYLNGVVPSNEGVAVAVDVPKCASR